MDLDLQGGYVYKVFFGHIKYLILDGRCNNIYDLCKCMVRAKMVPIFLGSSR
jgi:hypothetical protein